MKLLYTILLTVFASVAQATNWQPFAKTVDQDEFYVDADINRLVEGNITSIFVREVLAKATVSNNVIFNSMQYFMQFNCVTGQMRMGPDDKYFDTTKVKSVTEWVWKPWHTPPPKSMHELLYKEACTP